MEEEYLRLLQATKALVTYLDTENVFDKAVQVGRGDLDISRSEEFDLLIEKARQALNEFENDVT